MSIKIKPDCLNGKQVAFINKGFFVPCCQVDGWRQTEPFQELGFFDEKYNIRNLKNKDEISAVFESDIWQKFYKDVVENPESAPGVCQRVCGYKDGKKVQEFKRLANIEVKNV